MVQREQQACIQNIEVREEFQSLVPPLTPEEHSQLEAMLLAEGCRDALAIWQGVLLDGHNRYKICREHKLDFKTISIELDDENAAREWIIRNQFGRRNLSPSQRCKLALELKAVIQKEAKKHQKKSRGRGKKGSQISVDLIDTQKKLAKAAGVSHDTIAKYEYIQDKVDDETLEKLDRADTTINREWTRTKGDELRKQYKDFKAPDLPKGQYGVIVIDPPWPLQKIVRESRPNQIETDYPTMTIQEIESLEIPAANDCHLFCWTTQKFLPPALRIIEAWGFRYVFTMVWHKPGGFQPLGLAQYNCEFVLYARKGTPQFIDTKAFNTCFEAPRGKHSEKPQEFYDLLCRVTDGKRLDMFSRRQIEGFEVWGNEV